MKKCLKVMWNINYFIINNFFPENSNLYCLIKDNQIGSISDLVIHTTQMYAVDCFFRAWASSNDLDARKIKSGKFFLERRGRWKG